MWTYSELTSLGMNRGTYDDPTQIIDSLEQLHEEGHLKTLFAAFPEAARHNTSAAVVTTVCMLSESGAALALHPPCSSSQCSTEAPDISSLSSQDAFIY